ncbi:MAG TPA: TIM44-like domain-containing protein [Burkholderiales bacterium]|nr:TIM44-like domain-containing protein [Burkholderiales bacterium]
MVIGLGVAVQNADAARMGGGKSFGRQSPNVTRQSAPPSRDAAAQSAPRQAGQPVPQSQPAGNRWLGPLTGLAAGLGIAALLSHFGLGGDFGEGLSSVIMLALLAFAAVLVWRMLRGSRPGVPIGRGAEPAYSNADAGAGSVNAYNPMPGSTLPGSVASLSSTTVPWGVPPDFDTPSFIRTAKVNFIRLQAAWDAKNLADIREFTTPEVFAEIRMQIDEDKGANSRTDVVALEAELLGIEESAADYLASVKFTGSIRENERAGAEPVEEVWNLVKPKDARSGWLLAGIQQIH